MRVNFDSQIFCSQAVGGISRYFASIAKEMHARADVQAQILAPLHCNEYLKALPDGLLCGTTTLATHAPNPLFRAASLLGAGLIQRCTPSDILHRTYYYPYCHLPGPAKNVLTVYDMIHEKYPQHFSQRDPIARWKKRAVAHADKIICISENTRKDLLEHYDNVHPERVAVTHLGFDALDQLLPNETTQSFRTRALGADAPYILFVGHRAGYKNFSALLKAYSASPWLTRNFDLMCFGGGAFSEAEQALIASTPAAHRVRQMGGSDAVLASCYRHAALFVYPSLYEGFGIPPLEAMSMDCPVACSNTSSIPEVVGNAAAFFDPSDIDSIRQTLEGVLNSDATSTQLIERGKVRRKQYSWHRCAEETVGIYRATLAQ
ncbi:glycosyltransferase involved in cell wall biosynthesis [Rhodoferax ferrireducens]|uniref:Glycosyltransferase involved in cell wall biosynthesis n=1 Tax=Rhodoferax ferrireducens TaxID=192843 RepID=A0ABU2C2N8_9BURK|nr:glycosyltransferase family 1 protein [Rhodoferax ferrireducens]MDR7375596.1 glycosyltransferase involved in cell wall biosynthesis [Rhodoferax ferrireducens]